MQGLAVRQASALSPFTQGKKKKLQPPHTSKEAKDQRKAFPYLYTKCDKIKSNLTHQTQCDPKFHEGEEGGKERLQCMMMMMMKATPRMMMMLIL